MTDIHDAHAAIERAESEADAITAERTERDDYLEGADEIGRYLNISRRQVYHRRKLGWPIAFAPGVGLISSRTALDRYRTDMIEEALK